jgi:hypothetical protein
MKIMMMALGLALLAPMVRADEIDDLRDQLDQVESQQRQAYWDQWYGDWDCRHERHEHGKRGH